MTDDTNDIIIICATCELDVRSNDTQNCNNCNTSHCSDCLTEQFGVTICNHCTVQCNTCDHHNASYACMDCNDPLCSNCVYYYSGDPYCESCNNDVHCDDDDDDERYDYSSFQEYSNNPDVRPYHGMSDCELNFSRNVLDSNKSNRYLGIELELWTNNNFNYDTRSDILYLPQKYGLKHLYHFERDASVDLELVTNPCTLLYHKKDIDWRGLLSALSDKGLTGYQKLDKSAGSAGLHIHVSYEQRPEGYNCNYIPNRSHLGAKLYSFIVINRDALIKFSKRVTADQLHYAVIPVLSSSEGLQKDLRNPEKLSLYFTSRYSAINIGDSTIEYRLFRSTLDYDRFMACLEFSEALTLFVNTHSFAICSSSSSWTAFQNFLLKEKSYNHLIKYFRNQGLWDYLTNYENNSCVNEELLHLSYTKNCKNSNVYGKDNKDGYISSDL